MSVEVEKLCAVIVRVHIFVKSLVIPDLHFTAAAGSSSSSSRSMDNSPRWSKMRSNAAAERFVSVSVSVICHARFERVYGRLNELFDSETLQKPRFLACILLRSSLELEPSGAPC